TYSAPAHADHPARARRRRATARLPARTTPAGEYGYPARFSAFRGTGRTPAAAPRPDRCTTWSGRGAAVRGRRGPNRRAEAMADVRVERKEPSERRGPSIWPWIIGLLVLALLVWAIAEMVDTDETQVAEVEEVEPGQPVPPTAVPVPRAGTAS